MTSSISSEKIFRFFLDFFKDHADKPTLAISFINVHLVNYEDSPDYYTTITDDYMSSVKRAAKEIYKYVSEKGAIEDFADYVAKRRVAKDEEEQNTELEIPRVTPLPHEFYHLPENTTPSLMTTSIEKTPSHVSSSAGKRFKPPLGYQEFLSFLKTPPPKSAPEMSKKKSMEDGSSTSGGTKPILDEKPLEGKSMEDGSSTSGGIKLILEEKPLEGKSMEDGSSTSGGIKLMLEEKPLEGKSVEDGYLNSGDSKLILDTTPLEDKNAEDGYLNSGDSKLILDEKPLDDKDYREQLTQKDAEIAKKDAELAAALAEIKILKNQHKDKDDE